MSENKMPGMPGMPESNEESKENSVLQAPEHVSAFSSPVGDADASLAGKEDEEEKAPISLTSKKKIDVVALRKGFYNQHRLAEGDEFQVKKFEDLGEWMRCKDPVLEKKRVQFLKEKKEKARLK